LTLSLLKYRTVLSEFIVIQDRYHYILDV